MAPSTAEQVDRDNPEEISAVAASTVALGLGLTVAGFLRILMRMKRLTGRTNSERTFG